MGQFSSEWLTHWLPGVPHWRVKLSGVRQSKILSQAGLDVRGLRSIIGLHLINHKLSVLHSCTMYVITMYPLTLWHPNRPKPTRLSILLCLSGTPGSQWVNITIIQTTKLWPSSMHKIGKNLNKNFKLSKRNYIVLSFLCQIHCSPITSHTRMSGYLQPVQ